MQACPDQETAMKALILAFAIIGGVVSAAAYLVVTSPVADKDQRHQPDPQG